MKIYLENEIKKVKDAIIENYKFQLGIALPRASKILSQVIKVKDDSVYKKIKKELQKL